MILNLYHLLIGKLRAILLLLLLVVALNACEKDDICVDGDTPLLILRFYDANNTSEFKSVTNLRVVGLGQTTTVNTFTDRSSIDSIGIPLRIHESDTGFMLIVDSADEDEMETGNIDTLTFSYNTEEVFVSRACGFVANYDELGNELTTDTDNWIQNIEIVTASIKKLDSAHVKIFH